MYVFLHLSTVVTSDMHFRAELPLHLAVTSAVDSAMTMYIGYSYYGNSELGVRGWGRGVPVGRRTDINHASCH